MSARLFKIHLADPSYDPLKRVLVTIRGHKIKTSRQGHYIVATINLQGLPRGAFTVRISATTVLGHHLREPSHLPHVRRSTARQAQKRR